MVPWARPGIIWVIAALGMIMGCASSPYMGTGALLGGGVGSLAGAALAHNNPWQGAAIGGLIGTALGAAGGYALQPRPASPQGYYYPAPPGYGTATPPAYGYGYGAATPSAYGYGAAAPGSRPGGAYGYYAAPPAVSGPQPSATPPEPYSQTQPSQESEVRVPIVNVPNSLDE